MGILEGFQTALGLIAAGDRELLGVVALSLRVTGTALVGSALVGLPLGAAMGVFRFPGRRLVVTLVNALMGLPPVVVGLAVYLLLSREGPFATLGLLFTPEAMMVAQTALILPIVVALTTQTVEDLWGEYGDQLRSLGATRVRALPTLLFEGRAAVVTVLLAGLGRALAEVGAVQIVGGNIRGITRTMTTTIALETSRGDLALAMGLGLVLMGLAVVINGGAELLRGRAALVRT